MGKYSSELKRSMELLAAQPNSLFIGQAVAFEGTAMTNGLVDIPLDKRIELPVCEELQMGMSIGLSLQGLLPISIYPRWNFLLLAMNQLVNHLDKLPIYSGYEPKVIIRTSIGSENPMFPGHQHIGDFTDPIRAMLKTVTVVRLDEPEQIYPAYEEALKRPYSTILCEWGDYHGSK